MTIPWADVRRVAIGHMRERGWEPVSDTDRPTFQPLDPAEGEPIRLDLPLIWRQVRSLKPHEATRQIADAIARAVAANIRTAMVPWETARKRLWLNLYPPSRPFGQRLMEGVPEVLSAAFAVCPVVMTLFGPRPPTELELDTWKVTPDELVAAAAGAMLKAGPPADRSFYEDGLVVLQSREGHPNASSFAAIWHVSSPLAGIRYGQDVLLAIPDLTTLVVLPSGPSGKPGERGLHRLRSICSRHEHATDGFSPRLFAVRSGQWQPAFVQPQDPLPGFGEAGTVPQGESKCRAF